MDTAGYVYILINPSLNGVVKIGRTQNSPDERAKELSSATGVPTPFFVAYSSYFEDCNAAEIFVHTLLENNRLADNKEFFQVSVQQAIEAVREAESIIGMVMSQPNANMDLNSDEFSSKPLAAWEVVFHSANACFSGSGNTIQDRAEALQLYQKAAKLGSVSAYWVIGTMYLYGMGCNEDYNKAKSFFLNGTRVGNDLCWAGLGDVFYREAHFENWDKAWKKYFSSPFFVEDKKFEEYEDLASLMSLKEFQMCNYVNEAILNEWEMRQQDLIYERRAEILAFIDWYRTGTGEDDAYEQVIETIDNLVQQREAAIRISLLPPISDEHLKNKSPLEIFQIANQYYDASDSFSEQAIYLYEKAALAGFKLAYWKIGRIYLGRIYSGGHEDIQAREKAIKFLSEGAKLGVDLCWSELADIYRVEENLDKWNRCWKRYFESETFLNNTVFNELIEFDKLKSTREYQMFVYVQQADTQEWETPFMSIVAKHRQEIVELIMRDPKSIRIGETPVEKLLKALNALGPEKRRTAKDYCEEILVKIPTI